ncbi:MAG: helix-turn-helix domain-containing protein [Holophagales bacterium]|nr:helix-turn-helix domain-containing protein [Holophagales bacterium]
MAEGKLLTLTEVSNRTGISMPTLQRYKKEYQDRIPSEGQGRTQRYPESALEVFEKLKEENMKRRGRPRKNAADVGKRSKSVRRPPAARKEKISSEDGLLNLKQIEELTGISYPTLLRYTKTSLNRIPHVGTGRKRRYPQEAVNEFKILREESRRGRRSAGKTKTTLTSVGARRRSVASGASSSSSDVDGLVQQLKELQKSHAALQRQVSRLEKEVAKPFKVLVKR